MRLKIRKIHFYLLLLVGQLLCVGNAYATHLVGGELYYEDQGGGEYLVTLKVYRDCGPDNTNNTQFDEEAVIGIYSGSTLLDVIYLNLFEAEVGEVPIVLDNPCFILPPDLCIDEAVYTQEINLNVPPGGIDLSYQRCCRNGAIENVQNAAEMGMSLTAHIPGSSLTTAENSAPIFINAPPVALCLNADFFFDHSAADADGDSLAYRFYTPFHGGGTNGDGPVTDPNFVAPNPPIPPPFLEIFWEAGYNEDYQIAATPGFEIDPQTGYLTGNANELGRFAIGIAVDEYRDGLLINTTYRDFQYHVTICDPNIVAVIPSQEAYCDGLTFEFTNESINAESFYWDFGDPNTTTDISTEVNPVYTYQDSGTYTVTLIANPSWPCADTVTNTFEAFPTIAPSIEEPVFACIEGQGSYSFEAGGSFDFDLATVSWDFGENATTPAASGLTAEGIQFTSAGLQTVTMTVLENECEVTTTVDVEVVEEPIPIIPPQESFCEGYTIQFGNESQFAESYGWNFGVGVDGVQTGDPTPDFTFPGTGTYTVTLTASAPLTCPQSTNIQVEIAPLLDPFFEQPLSSCLEGNSFDFSAEGFNEPDAQFEWNFGGAEIANPGTSAIEEVLGVNFLQAGIHPITLTISENGCTQDYQQDVHIFPNMDPGFYGVSTNGCPPHIAQFIDTTLAGTPLNYLWDFGDGVTSNSSNPQHTYTSPGSYSVSMTVWTTGGCLEEETVTINNLVNINPKPTAGFDVDEYVLSIFEPLIEISDNSENSVSCEYWTTDGGYATDCDWSYTFTDGGIMEIVQVVSNEFGCTDTARVDVVVEGFTFYAPSAFSPTGDGLNDVWQPIMMGVDTYHLQIFNRWGEMIHESIDPEMPWLGGKDKAYAQDGVYAYQVIITDKLGQPHQFKGSITIFR